MSPLMYSLDAFKKHYEKPGEIDFFNPLSISAASDVQEMNLLGRSSQTLFFLHMCHQVAIVSSAALSLSFNTRYKGQW